MNVKQLIAILSEMDGEADVCLAVNVFDERAQVWGTDLTPLDLDALVLGSTYAAFQVPSDREETEE